MARPLQILISTITNPSMTLSANLIEHYEQEQDLKLTKSQKRHLNKQRPIAARITPSIVAPPNSKRLPKLEYMLWRAKAYRLKYPGSSTTEPILHDSFHHKLLKGKPGAFNDLIRFLEDQSKDFSTIGLKNYYLKLLKELPLTNQQQAAIRRIIWDYANSSGSHRIRLYCRLAIRFSSPEFHLAVTTANKPENKAPGWKLHRLRQHLDLHCPETKPK